MAGVELRGLGKRYPNGVDAVASVDLTVGEGEFFAIVGPSGSGKSTLLRMIAGLEAPTAGTVAIGGRDVTTLPPRDRDLAMVFQEAALFPHLSVFDNLAFGLRARGGKTVGRDEVRERVEAAAGGLGLRELLGRKPETLSGGQRQRVAFGRAIVRRPSVFLFDEPLSGLDAPLRAAIRADLIDLHRDLAATMLYVTHDQGEALATADRLAVMDRGRIAQVGTPAEVYHAPASRTVARFVGDPPMNLLPVVLATGDEPTLTFARNEANSRSERNEANSTSARNKANPRSERNEANLGSEQNEPDRWSEQNEANSGSARNEVDWQSGRDEANSESARNEPNLRVGVPPPMAPGFLRGREAVDLGIRAEDVHLAGPGVGDRDPRLAWLPGLLPVVRSEYLGHETVVTLALGGRTLASRQRGLSPPRPGDALSVGLDLGRASWFDPESGEAIRP